MAKKRPIAAKPQPKTRDSVGWGFWLAVFLVLFVPAWYFARNMTVPEQQDTFVPWVTGFALSAVAAGVLSTLVNYVLRSRAAALKRRTAQLKKPAKRAAND